MAIGTPSSWNAPAGGTIRRRADPGFTRYNARRFSVPFIRYVCGAIAVVIQTPPNFVERISLNRF